MQSFKTHSLRVLSFYGSMDIPSVIYPFLLINAQWIISKILQQLLDNDKKDRLSFQSALLFIYIMFKILISVISTSVPSWYCYEKYYLPKSLVSGLKMYIKFCSVLEGCKREDSTLWLKQRWTIFIFNLATLTKNCCSSISAPQNSLETFTFNNNYIFDNPKYFIHYELPIAHILW